MQILSLIPTQIFHNTGTSYSSGVISAHNNYANEELIKQLQIKDEQIQKLTALVDKLLTKVTE